MPVIFKAPKVETDEERKAREVRYHSQLELLAKRAERKARQAKRADEFPAAMLHAGVSAALALGTGLLCAYIFSGGELLLAVAVAILVGVPMWFVWGTVLGMMGFGVAAKRRREKEEGEDHDD